MENNCCNPLYAYQTGYKTKHGKDEYFIDFQRISHGEYPLSRNQNINVNYHRKDIVKLINGHPCLVKYVKLPCGKCPACNLRKSAEWSTRMYYEATQHALYYFTTLTYDESHKKTTTEEAKRDFQLFMKRLRKVFGVENIKYFTQYEYGEKTKRGHFHVVFFLDKVPDDKLTYIKTIGQNNYYDSEKINQCWQQGFNLTAVCTNPNGVFAYVSRYTSKKSGSSEGFHLQSLGLGNIAKYSIVSGSYLLIHNNGRTYHASIPEYVKKVLEKENETLYNKIKENTRVWINLQYRSDKNAIDKLDPSEYYKESMTQFLAGNKAKFKRSL